METNSLEPLQQAKIIWVSVSKKPIRTSLLLVVVVASVIATVPHELIVIMYSAGVADAESRRVETLLIVNHNKEKHELIAQFSLAGEPNELGFDYSYAVDLASKSHRFAKFNVVHDGMAVLNLIRKKEDANPVKILGTTEVKQSESVMGRIFCAYLLSWFGTLSIYSNMATVGLGILILYSPVRSIRAALGL